VEEEKKSLTRRLTEGCRGNPWGNAAKRGGLNQAKEREKCKVFSKSNEGQQRGSVFRSKVQSLGLPEDPHREFHAIIRPGLTARQGREGVNRESSLPRIT